MIGFERLAVLATAAAAWEAPARRALSRLLLQRSVQTQTVYLTDFHDEMKADWLATYQNPAAPMDTVRISNSECLPRYHGLDGFPHVDNVDYLRSMMREEPFTYQVRYRVGTAPGLGGGAFGSPEPAADEAFKAGMDLWGGSAAARSRRNNPFLKDHVKYIEYDETVVPSRTAQLLLSTQRQLADEWRVDLRAIVSGELDDETDIPEGASDAERTARETSRYAIRVRENAMAEASENGGSGASPLRAANLDLCERLATRVAARSVLADGDLPPAAAARLEACLTRLEVAEKAPADEGDAAPTSVDDAELSKALNARAEALAAEKMDALGGHARRRGLAHRWLAGVGNDAVAMAVVRRRAEIATHWAEGVVDDVAAAHALLLRDSLEDQFNL